MTAVSRRTFSGFYWGLFIDKLITTPVLYSIYARKLAIAIGWLALSALHSSVSFSLIQLKNIRLYISSYLSVLSPGNHLYYRYLALRRGYETP